MTIMVTEDIDAPGGFAFADLGRRIEAAPIALSIRRRLVEPRQLGTEGWQTDVVWLAPESVDHSSGSTVLRLGPSIVDWIEELVDVEISIRGEGVVGSLSWPSITPSARSLTGVRLGPAPRAIPETEAESPPGRLEAVDRLELEIRAVAEAIAPAEAAQASATPASSADEAQRDGAANANSKRGLITAAILLLIGAGAVTYFMQSSQKPPAQAQAAPPAAEVQPRRTSEEALERRFYDIRNAGSSAGALAALATEALENGAGRVAFQAFEEMDPVRDSEAAWRMARFYDPRLSEPTLRDVAVPNAARAAHYYGLWKDRSDRHARELRELCQALRSGQISGQRAAAECGG
jgi:hypothetical protein